MKQRHQPKIGDFDIASLFAPIAGRRALLAVSGGPDSVALMRAGAEWRASPSAAGAELMVATVDHGLRPGSRREAEMVGRWAEALGLSHCILTWTGAKPKTRIQERARAARYALLSAHARALGAQFLLTAHHADDQAETILFRLLRGSGLAGLAGMQSLTKLDGVALYRPLLNLAKITLIAYCEANGQPFIRDPSNENPAFARTRLRELSPVLAKAGLDTESLARLGRRAARAEGALAAEAAQTSARLERTQLPDGIAVSRRDLRDVPEEILRRVIGAEIAACGAGTPMRLDRLESLAQDLYAAMQTGAIWHRTLGGVKLCAGTDGLLTLRREKPRRACTKPASTSPKACDHFLNTATP